MGIDAHLAVSSMVLGPFRKDADGWAVGVHSPSSRLPSGGSPMNTMCQHHCLIGVICIHLSSLASTFAVGGGYGGSFLLCCPGRALCFSLLARGSESLGPPGTLSGGGMPALALCILNLSRMIHV